MQRHAVPLPTRFEASVVPNRDEVAVVAAGEMDLATAHLVAEAVEELREAGFRKIVVDLHRVEFIDSAGLRMLLELRGQAERDGHVLALVTPPPGTRRIFEVTRTQELFEWRDRFVV